MNWQGVMPAITTPFHADGTIDHGAVTRHVRWLVASGATGIVPCGSLGEGATLEHAEKVALIRTCVEATAGKVPVVPGIAASATASGVRLAQEAEVAGCRGLMLLPPYVHKGTEGEVRAHFEALLAATKLPCMLYNNPPAYGFDATPPFLASLAERYPRLVAVKESSGDVRRISAVRALCGERLALFAGLDDMVLEALAMGASGWVAGLANALPEESVRLFRLGREGHAQDAFALYTWFLPLLRLDTVPEFVQWIKLVQAEVGHGDERVRAPRRPIEGDARAAGLEMIRACLATPR